MSENTDSIRRTPPGEARLDGVDQRLLAALAEDSSLSYADLGKRLNLSPPAVHERVKRLKRDGVIQATVARLDGQKLGRPLLAFVHVYSRDFNFSHRVDELAALPDIEEIHVVTGESGALLKVRTRDTHDLEKVLAAIHRLEGVESTRSLIALSTHLERGPSPL